MTFGEGSTAIAKESKLRIVSHTEMFTNDVRPEVDSNVHSWDICNQALIFIT